MIYAPVLITTLNRYDHFKQCLESLEKCSDADKTDVYVALDYPPCEKYVEGWKRIDLYLHSKEIDHVFRHLYVMRRKHNCGIFKDDSNLNLLIDYVRNKSDRLIISEDDNVFSPNFLEYINKGLEFYKDDPHVFAITGYSQPYPFKSNGNSYFFHNTDFSAWGVGFWFSKMDDANKQIRDGLFKQNLSLKNILKFYHHGLNRLQQYVVYSFSDYNYALIDCVYSCYIILNDMYVAVPVETKVRNIGWDEQGQSFINKQGRLRKMREIAKTHKEQRIDEDKHFDYIGNPFSFYDYNNSLTAKLSEAKIGWHECLSAIMVRVSKFYLNKVGLKKWLLKCKNTL